MQKVKLADVATFAKVSKSTVSQYLNGRYEYMSAKTQERVRAAIAELDYVPNPIARNLKADKTKTIGVIVRDITGFYTSKAIRGIDDYCKKHDYHALIYNTDFNSDIEAKSLESLYQMRVDGIIIASSGKNMALIAQYIEKGMPIVQFQVEHDGSEKNIILSDYKQAAFEATEYLIELGHSKICFVTQEYQHVKSNNERFLGYTAALAKHNIPIDPALIQLWNRDTGFAKSVCDIMSELAPSAFFTQHLAITAQLLTELEQNKISIPDDVSVLGFDDIPMVDFFKVPITVVRQAPYVIGSEAAQMLLHNIEQPSIAAQRMMVACTLDKRLSCKQMA